MKPVEDVTDTELEVLKILWKSQTLSAKEVHEELTKITGWSYSTSRTVIERMVKKGLVKKGDLHGLNVYSPKVSRVHTLGKLIARFAENVLETDPRSVAALFGENSSLNRKELAEMSQLFKDRIGAKAGRREK